MSGISGGPPNGALPAGSTQILSTPVQPDTSNNKAPIATSGTGQPAAIQPASTNLTVRILSATRGQVLLDLPQGQMRAQLPEGFSGARNLTLQMTSTPTSTANPQSPNPGSMPAAAGQQQTVKLTAIDGKPLQQPMTIRLMPPDAPDVLPARLSDPMPAMLSRQTAQGTERLGTVTIQMTAAPSTSVGNTIPASVPVHQNLTGVVQTTATGDRSIQLGRYSLTPQISLKDLPNLTPITVRIVEFANLPKLPTDRNSALDALARALLGERATTDVRKTGLNDGPDLARALVRLVRQVGAPQPASTISSMVADDHAAGDLKAARSMPFNVAAISDVEVQPIRSDDTRGVLVPFGGHDGEEPRPLAVWQRQAESDDPGQADRQHVMFTLDLSELGQIRIDLSHNPERLDATVTSANRLPDELRAELADLYGAGLELTGLAGLLVTRVDVREAAPPVPASLQDFEI